ncbi:MAG: hypothetical protein HUJ54_05020 [Erysipelotrichaceae bacterium]|nr:hypothetical protein [Erysipelotrichaceae bacterium]
MAKPANVRSILKDKANFKFDLRSSEKDGERTTNVYDVMYEGNNGKLTVVFDESDIYVATLHFSMGKLLSLANDANMKKLAKYVLEQ